VAPCSNVIIIGNDKINSYARATIPFVFVSGVDGKTRSAGHRNARPEIPNRCRVGELLTGRHARR